MTEYRGRCQLCEEPEEQPPSWLWLWIAIAGIVLCCGMVFCYGAPAPKPRAVKPLVAADLVGEWTLDWLEWGGTARFARDGYYSESYTSSAGDESEWEGRWSLADGVLTITEWPKEPSAWRASRVTCRIKLAPGKRAGTMEVECIWPNGQTSEGTGRFALRPPPKRKPDA